MDLKKRRRMMSKQNGKKGIHSIVRDNVIPFPKPSTPSSSRGEEDVGGGERYTIHFEPDWDGWGDDSEDSKT